MRLISCHIENFGKIHDYSVSFSEGLNIFCEENGWGKSTFAAFVRAMFFGLKGERKRSIEENERKKYKPWQGGVFGGQVNFEIQGKEYQISRVFKDKEANDEFELRDAETNLLSSDYSQKIGEEIFKIGRESFIRTIFIGQNECETSATDDINAKIGNLADNTNDLNNYDAANTKLTEILNALTPKRITGSLSKRKNEIAKYERMIRDGQGISESIDTYQGYLHTEEVNYEQLKLQMKEAGEKQTEVSKVQSIIAKKSEWERLKKSVSEKDEEVENLRNGFSGEIPKMEDLRSGIAECRDLEKAGERVHLNQMSEKEKADLSSLAVFFAKGVPDDTVMNQAIDDASRFTGISKEYESEQMSDSEKVRLKELEPYFANETQTIVTMVSKWGERNNKKTALPSNQAALTALKASAATQKPQGKKHSLLLFLIGIIAIIVGVYLIAAVSKIIGGIIAVIGAGFLLFGMYQSKRDKMPVQPEESPEIINLQRIIAEDSLFIESTDAEIADYLKAHGRVFDEYMVSTFLQEITSESVEYNSLKRKAQAASDSSKLKEKENLQQRIISFLGSFEIQFSESRFMDDLYMIKSGIYQYKILADKHENLQNAEEEYKVLKEKLVKYLEKYGFNPETDLTVQFNDIRDNVEIYQNALKIRNDAALGLSQFEEANDVSLFDNDQADENLPTLEEINQEILELTEKMEKVHNTIVSYSKTLDGLQEKYDEWEDSCIRFNELNAQQAKEQKKYDHIRKAQEKLEQAKEAMTSKYADPIREGFCKYYEMITKNNAGNFHVDANTRITVDELGKQREVNTLSIGYRDLVGICLRIALVDAMYQEELPMLLLDDPFANLDDGKVGAAKDFLEKLAEQYQIIYFTCSFSRS